VKAAWIRPGGGAIPDGAKAHAWGITTLFYDATDPQISADFFEKVRSWGFKPGITRDPTWNSASAVDLAREMDADLVRLGSENKTCYAMADIEALWNRGSAYVLAWLTEWRRLRPTRQTFWTTEPMQGGVISDTLVARINSDPNIIVVPQLYYKGMVDAVESRVALDLAGRKIRPDRIYPYYDAEDMPAAWDGIVFDFAKLPAQP
jgi:hypothetical protein